MNLLSLILFLSVASLWFFSTEYETLFGVYGPTCAVRRRIFNVLVFTILMLSLRFSDAGAVADSMTSGFSVGPLDCESVMIMLLASLIVLVVLRYFGIKGSVVYALLGSLSAYGLLNNDGVNLRFGFLLSFLAAPVMACLISYIVRSLLKLLFSRVKLHMMTVSYYMRHAVIVCIVLTAAALGFNWGGFLCSVGELMHEASAVRTELMIIVGVMMVVTMYFAKTQSDEPSGTFADFSIYAVVSTGLAVAVTLLFFSFETTAASVGLAPVPLSVSTLVAAAVFGAELAQRSRLVDNEEYVRETVAFAAVPMGAFLLTSLILHLACMDPGVQMDDFVILSAAILMLVALAFAGYVRNQRFQKDATDRLVYTQQQQIYEHSRALNDMELKVVLSENQALHNAVEMKKQEVMNVALSIVEQREFLESLNGMVKALAKEDDPKYKDKIVAELGSAIRQRLSYEGDVDSQYFYAQAESLHEDFSAKMSENFPNLTQQEKRLATLLRLGFSSKYIASLMNITPKSVEISRYRLRQKLGLEKGDNLVSFIKSI